MGMGNKQREFAENTIKPIREEVYYERPIDRIRARFNKQQEPIQPVAQPIQDITPGLMMQEIAETRLRIETVIEKQELAYKKLDGITESFLDIINYLEEIKVENNENKMQTVQKEPEKSEDGKG